MGPAATGTQVVLGLCFPYGPRLALGLCLTCNFLLAVPPGTDDMSTGTNHDSDAQLEVRIESASPGRLTIDFVLTNVSLSPLFAFNQVYRRIEPTGRYPVDSDLVYIEKSADGAIISKKIVAVPEDVDVEKPIVPCATEIAPGASLHETLTVDWPFETWTPYDSPLQRRGEKLAPETPFYFQLGYFRGLEDSISFAKTVNTPLGQGLLFEPFDPTKQRTLQVGPFQVPLSE